MKKNVFILMLICLGVIPAIRAQENILNVPERKLNTVYLEAFGQGLYYSLNYDRLLMAKHRFPASVSVGVTVLPIFYLSVVATPVSFNGLIGKGSHYLELGIGVTPMYIREKDVTVGHSVSDAHGNVEYKAYKAYSDNFFLHLTPRIGYRFQRPQGGFFAKITFTPQIGLISHWGEMKNAETGNSSGFGGHTNYFNEGAAFFRKPVMPWAGISFGWTF